MTADAWHRVSADPRWTEHEPGKARRFKDSGAVCVVCRRWIVPKGEGWVLAR